MATHIDPDSFPRLAADRDTAAIDVASWSVPDEAHAEAVLASFGAAGPALAEGLVTHYESRQHAGERLSADYAAAGGAVDTSRTQFLEQEAANAASLTRRVR